MEIVRIFGYYKIKEPKSRNSRKKYARNPLRSKPMGESFFVYKSIP